MGPSRVGFLGRLTGTPSGDWASGAWGAGDGDGARTRWPGRLVWDLHGLRVPVLGMTWLFGIFGSSGGWVQVSGHGLRVSRGFLLAGGLDGEAGQGRVVRARLALGSRRGRVLRGLAISVWQGDGGLDRAWVEGARSLWAGASCPGWGSRRGLVSLGFEFAVLVSGGWLLGCLCVMGRDGIVTTRHAGSLASCCVGRGLLGGRVDLAFESCRGRDGVGDW